MHTLVGLTATTVSRRLLATAGLAAVKGRCVAETRLTCIFLLLLGLRLGVASRLCVGSKIRDKNLGKWRDASSVIGFQHDIG